MFRNLPIDIPHLKVLTPRLKFSRSISRMIDNLTKGFLYGSVVTKGRVIEILRLTMVPLSGSLNLRTVLYFVSLELQQNNRP